MIRMLLIAAMCLATGTAAYAQSVPPITRSKQVATRAADAASERVRAQTSVTDETPSADSAARSRAAVPGTASAPRADTTGSRRPGTTTGRTSSTTRRGSTGGAAVDSVRPEGPGTRNELVLMREVFRYDDGGRRDPFVSLMESGELRPVVSDLRLIGVIYDPTGRRSLATLRDVTTNELYRVAVGNVLGRTRVTHIQPKQITMTIEEFGFSRQLVLILGDTTGTRTER